MPISKYTQSLRGLGMTHAGRTVHHCAVFCCWYSMLSRPPKTKTWLGTPFPPRNHPSMQNHGTDTRGSTCLTLVRHLRAKCPPPKPYYVPRPRQQCDHPHMNGIDHPASCDLTECEARLADILLWRGRLMPSKVRPSAAHRLSTFFTSVVTSLAL